jgi:hypothetical protein
MLWKLFRLLVKILLWGIGIIILGLVGLFVVCIVAQN